jgi:hypothetical protein
MTTRKPRRRPIRSDTLEDLQTLLDRAQQRDADENPTPKTENDDAR